MENAVKLNKGQVLDLLMDSGRYAWQVRVTQRVKGSALPTAYCTFTLNNLEEIAGASGSRTYGLVTLYTGGNTRKVAQVHLQVGNTTYAFNIEG
jgi:hypothetical protein